jgi:hypothetical protein
MNIGMMWFDDAKNKTLHAKIREAAQYFRRKFEKIPEVVLVNPKELESDKGFALDVFNEFVILVRPWKSVLPSHLWIGVEDLSQLPKSESEPTP